MNRTRHIHVCVILLSFFMLAFAIGFNLWLYRAEPTALVDPNDNAFQYALVARTNEIWTYADKTCPKNLSFVICHLSLLIDHWVPNWAEGYNLPYYYSHVPQIAIVGSYKFLTAISYQLSAISLFTYYHWIIYLLLCFFPLSVFLSLRLIRLPWFTAGIGALLATQLSTDGLYGLDPSSFLWRGWGLSSQLFAMIWMPLAIAYLIKITNSNPQSATRNPLLTNYFFAILFITLTTMGHLGIGMMLFLAIPVITFTKPVLTLCKNSRLSLEEIWEAIIKTVLIALPPLLILSYWILPTLLNSQYHNISFWDPLWKFNSYGVQEILVHLTNGALFDFGRIPIITGLVFIGFFVCLLTTQRQKTMSKGQNVSDAYCLMSYEFPTLAFLFLFFLFLYFGSTTWGPLMNLIPGMQDFHQHRFIVGIHLMALFLAPIGFTYIINQFIHYGLLALPTGRRIANVNPLSAIRYPLSADTSWKVQSISLCLPIFLSSCLLVFLIPQTIKYGVYNEELIQKANAEYLTQKSDADLLLETLHTLPPGRIFAGRGGGWGKEFHISQTSYFMYLSTYGFPTVLWLPQTWSLNSDTEQYFSEDVPSHYELYNIRYVVTPNTVTPQKFWTLIKESTSWKLYGVDIRQEDPTSPRLRGAGNEQETEKYITTGTSPTVVFSDKQSFANVVRLWIQSDYPKKQLFPELRITKNPQSAMQNQSINLPHFAMTDEATYETLASTSAQLGEPNTQAYALFAHPPLYMTPWEWPEAFASMTNDQLRITNEKQIRNSQFVIDNYISILSQSSDTDMVFTATVEVKEPCPTCVVILKQTYHPNWKVTVNGKPGETIQVFPAFTALRLEQKGTYNIIFSYTPSRTKMILLTMSILLVLVTLGASIMLKYRK